MVSSVETGTEPRLISKAENFGNIDNEWNQVNTIIYITFCRLQQLLTSILSFKVNDESSFCSNNSIYCNYSFPTGGNIFSLLGKLMLSAGRAIIFPLPET